MQKPDFIAHWKNRDLSWVSWVSRSKCPWVAVLSIHF